MILKSEWDTWLPTKRSSPTSGYCSALTASIFAAFFFLMTQCEWEVVEHQPISPRGQSAEFKDPDYAFKIHILNA